MHPINALSPERMTPKQRREELARLLATALVRLRSCPRQSTVDLGFSARPCLHGDPVHNPKTESP